MGAADSKGKLDEAVRENRRSISRSVRELDREALALDRLEQQLLSQIRSQAIADTATLQRVHARQIVRVRKRRTALLACRAQLLGAKLQLQQMQSMQQLQQHLQSSAQVLMKVNKTLNLPQLESVMNDFMHESHRLGLLEEMMTDVIDNATADTEEEEAEEAIVNQVLQCASANLSHRLAAAPPPCHLDVPVSVGSVSGACEAQSLEPERVAPEASGLLQRPRCEQRVGLPTLLVSGGFGGDTRLNQGAVCEMEREMEKRLLYLRR
ncbi:SNF7 family protein [Toxoplasma gondii GT1]|uniref:SNF7 family protein n=2 Tax=Toxoplasma gondii TaxID=5811 RepID=S7VPF6_TOXGG|nr:SNF7 family protein [Toxoplasma gondii GT1]KAF4643624.1 SNF7 family protein [Toxoplasma gondii]